MSGDKAVENLIRIYRAAQDRLIDTILSTTGVGTKVYANTILLQVNKQLKRLEKHSAFYVRSAVPAAYRTALNEIYTYFKRNRLRMNPPAPFAHVNADAVYAIAREMQYQIGQGLEQAGRRVVRYVNDARDETLRQAGLAAAGEKFAAGSTLTQMKNNLAGKLKGQGVLSVQYGNGPGAYLVSIDAYAGMVARSLTREAGNLARENQLTQNGYDLVQMSSHYPTCEICAPLQGRVYSVSGKDTRFPPLSKAFRGGYHNVHPNCRHIIVPWIESLHSPDEIREAIRLSSLPFSDNRSPAEQALYSRQQAENRQARQDLYQFERYRSILGPDSPRSLGNFRRIKKADGERWKFIQLDYRRRCRLSDHPELALPGAEAAKAPDAKFTGYLFNPDNPSGLAKGVAISRRLGYNKGNWKELQEEIVRRAWQYPATYRLSDQYGSRYEQRIVLYGKKGTPANMVVGWNVKNGAANMTSCYLKEVK